MIPVLSDSYPYTKNGLGGLADALECTVTHEVNGIYELKLRYPITGEHYAELLPQYFINAKPDALTQTQPFRIYRITKPLNGVVTVYARHISYDMAGIVVEPFSDTSLTAALLSLPNHCTPSLPFTITSTKSVATAFSLSAPRELWRLLGGSAGSFLDIYGGEWDFDLLTATLRTRLGSDRGVKIRYGKNLTGLEQDATLESTYSGVYPYWYDEETGTLVEIANKYVPITGASVTNRLLLLDCSADFETQPTEAQLTARATAYIEDNSVGSPKTSWKVNFAMLAQAGEYETQGALESVALGDTLEVIYETLGVNASARVVKIEYDTLKEQYKNVTVGRVKQNLASIIVGQNAEMDAKIQTAKSELERAVDRSTDFIRNGAGYMRLIYDGDTLKEIVSLDNPDISLAQKVWRWNNGGFGFSSTGYNGTYGLALTQNGEIVADYITAGTMAANRVRTGLLEDQVGKWSVNLDTGYATLSNATIGGFTIDATSIRTAALTSNASGSIGLSIEDFTRTINGTSRSGLRLALGSNFGVTNTGILYASGVDISGTFSMTGGTINVSTTDNARSIIVFNGNQRTMTLTPSMIKLESETASHGTETAEYGAALGLRMYTDDGAVAQLTPSGALLLGGAGMGASGSLTIRDSSTITRGLLNTTGLTFYNSSGTQTALYLASRASIQASYVSNSYCSATAVGRIYLLHYGFMGAVLFNLTIDETGLPSSAGEVTIGKFNGITLKEGVFVNIPAQSGSVPILAEILADGTIKIYCGSGTATGWHRTVIPVFIA